MCVRAGQESREAFRSWRSVSRVWTASDRSVLHPPNSPPPPPTHHHPPPPLFALFACNHKPARPTDTHTQQMIHRKWRSNYLFWGNGSKVADSSRLFTRVRSTLILKLNQIKGYLTTASLKHSSLKCRRYLQLKWMLRAPCTIRHNCRAHATPPRSGHPPSGYRAGFQTDSPT